MSNTTFQTFVNIVRSLADLGAFLAAIALSYLTLEQPTVKKWLAGTSILVKVVTLLVLTSALAQIGFWVIGYIFALPSGLANYRNGFESSIECITGLVMLGALVGAIVLLSRKADSEKKQGEVGKSNLEAP